MGSRVPVDVGERTDDQVLVLKAHALLEGGRVHVDKDEPQKWTITAKSDDSALRALRAVVLVCALMENRGLAPALQGWH